MLLIVNKRFQTSCHLRRAIQLVDVKTRNSTYFRQLGVTNQSTGHCAVMVMPYRSRAVVSMSPMINLTEGCALAMQPIPPLT